MNITKKNKKISLGLLILGVIIVVGFMLKGKISHEQFDSTKWKNWVESEAEISLRWNMMNDLRNQHELKGKSKAEIIDLLGEPENKNKNYFRYYLGYSKQGFNTGNLTIIFNDEDTVIKFKVRDG